MSSTTRMSASLSALAPRSLASRTSSPRRNLYISGHGVGLTMRERIPIWPSRRASAVSEPHPSPSALMWVDIATERPARSSCARRSIDSRRCWGTLRRSSTAFRACQLRMRSAVGEVDHEADRHPDDESLPRGAGKTGHHIAADENSENRHDRHKWGAKRSRQIGRAVAQRNHAPTHDDEGKQGSDRHQLPQQTNREESSHDRGNDAREDSRHVGCVEFRMNLAEYRWQQTVTRHRVEDAWLAHKHDKNDRRETRDCSDIDDRTQPGEGRTSLLDGYEYRVWNIEFGVARQPSHHQRHQDI